VWDILKQLYPYCATLKDTVATLSPECALIRNINNDDNSYIKFCDSIIVAASMIPEGTFILAQTRTQLEILHAVIEVRANGSSLILQMCEFSLEAIYN